MKYIFSKGNRQLSKPKPFRKRTKGRRPVPDVSARRTHQFLYLPANYTNYRLRSFFSNTVAVAVSVPGSDDSPVSCT